MIHGNYIKECFVERDDPSLSIHNTWWGSNSYNEKYSPYHRSLNKVVVRNYLLYKAKYLNGEVPFTDCEARERTRILTDFYKLILANTKYAIAVAFSTYWFSRRTRYFL